MWVMWSISSWNGGLCCYSNGLVSQCTCWLYSLWFMWLIPYLLLFTGLLKCHFLLFHLHWADGQTQHRPQTEPGFDAAACWWQRFDWLVFSWVLEGCARVMLLEFQVSVGVMWAEVGSGVPYMGALWSGLGPLVLIQQQVGECDGRNWQRALRSNETGAHRLLFPRAAGS